MTGAKIIMECLLEQGVDTVFGYPGGQIIDTYDALYDYSDKIRHILTSHEQGACHAADGYARATGKTGVVIATSGPGATNLVTGIATAYMDSTPLVAITGNVVLNNLGRDSFQEVDITGITMPITKHNYIVKDVAELADTIREAFYIAKNGRPGPVLVDVPKDIQQAQTDFSKKAVQSFRPKAITKERVSEAVRLLEESERPLLYVGGGIISAGATDEIIKLAELADIPVACSLMGLGGFPGNHPNYLGLIGMHGHAACAYALQEADLVVVVGARFSDRVAGDRSKFAVGAKILHIDIDNAEINKNIPSTCSVLGDAKEVLKTVNSCLKKKDRREWLNHILSLKKEKTISDSKYNPNPKRVIEELRAMCGDDQIIATDVGQHQMWTAQFYQFNKPRTFLTSGGLGTMGFGMGAAIGASCGTGKKIFLFTGDGSFHMNLNEFATCVRNQIPVVVIVMNNHVLGMVRQWQKLFFHNHFSQTVLNHKTDFVKLAEAFGGKGYRINENGEIKSVLKQAMAEAGPVIVEVELSSDENVLPMIPAGKAADDMITEMD